MAIKRENKVVATLFKDAAFPKGSDKPNVDTVRLGGGDINDLPLVIGVKIAGEPDDLISALPSGK